MYNSPMGSRTDKDKPISLKPLTTSQALAAALRIKPADLKAAAEAEKATQKGNKKDK